MSTLMHTPAPETETPLFDLSGLIAGIRWRRRLWASLALVGLLLGVAAATVLPTRATATAAVYVVHENETSGAGQSLMKTDLALLQTTTVAAVAVDKLQNGLSPEKFVGTYSGTVLADNILQIIARGSNDAEALARVQAVADAFIAVQVKKSTDAARATAAAYIDRRGKVQQELNSVNAQITRPSSGADLQSLYDRRGSLSSQIAGLTQQAESAGIGAPQVAAGTKILNAPHLASHGFLFGLALYGGIGLAAGLALGLLFAAVVTVMRDRPVLRRDLVAHLGASVVAQIPAPLRGPRRLIRRSSPEKERARVAATLVRLVRTSSEPVSVLDVGCTRVAAALLKDIATELAAEEPVMVVDDLRGDEMTKALGEDSGVELVAGTDFPSAKPVAPEPRPRQLGIATLGPGTPWTDLRRLGTEALVVVRAGRTEATWLHTIARQLADTGIAIIGLVVVHPDPRDKTDGTLWDALYTAIRGRAAVAGGVPMPTAPAGFPTPDALRRAVPVADHREHVLVAAAATNGNGRTNVHTAGNGHLVERPTEIIPHGARVIRIDAPTMVIPANSGRIGRRRPTEGNGTGRLGRSTRPDPGSVPGPTSDDSEPNGVADTVASSVPPRSQPNIKDVDSTSPAANATPSDATAPAAPRPTPARSGDVLPVGASDESARSDDVAGACDDAPAAGPPLTADADPAVPSRRPPHPRPRPRPRPRLTLSEHPSTDHQPPAAPGASGSEKEAT